MPKGPLRLLIVLPSWIGDAVMATPILRAVRSAFPGAFLGALSRPGPDQLFLGTDLVDELHVARAQGVMGPKRVAALLRPRRYDTALLLPNSFSAALIARVAGIPRRIGYERDGRSLLLTDGLARPRTPTGELLVVSLPDYYYNLARRTLLPSAGALPSREDELVPLPPATYMELSVTPADEVAAEGVLRRAALADAPLVMLTPGANSDHKRWPADRFAEVGRHAIDRHGCAVLVTGSPAERELADSVVAAIDRPARAASLPALGLTIPALKAICRRCALMVTNDTGPRHIAAALGVPLVSLFGPTDYRWAAVPTRPGAPEEVIRADPTLHESQLANDHPERCAMPRIDAARVIAAVDRALRATYPTGARASAAASARLSPGNAVP